VIPHERPQRSRPVKQYHPGEPLILKNIEISQQDAAAISEQLANNQPGIIKVRDTTSGASLELIHAACNESDCAVWDNRHNCCSFLAVTKLLATK